MWNKSTVANTYFLATWNVVNNNQEKSSNINLGEKGWFTMVVLFAKYWSKNSTNGKPGTPPRTHFANPKYLESFKYDHIHNINAGI